MKNACAQCSATFEITEEDLALFAMLNVGHDQPLPMPKSCPDCRLQRRLCERNTRSLYYRKCDLTGKQIVSQYHSEQPFPVYGVEAWMSDDWDATKYAQEIDFTASVFTQLQNLFSNVPHLALFNTPGTMENSDYNNCTGYLKNCYLICESDICEDSYYSNLLKQSKDLCDCSVCYRSELCYECINCISCRSLIFSQDCQNCSDSAFLKQCRGCRDCLGCINLRNKQYMICNKQYTKEDYEKYKAQFRLDTRSGLKKLERQAQEFFLTQPHRAVQIEQSENCTGDRINTCKNAHKCFDVADIEDCRYCQFLSLQCKTCMDFNSWGQNSELIYECSGCGDRSYACRFCSTSITLRNCEYCVECVHSQDLFCCMGLKNKRFCIFNKQYEETEYRALRKKLIEHMTKLGEYGEFLPMSLCAFAYNESFAPDFIPLTQEEVAAKGWKWHEDKEAQKSYMGAETTLPDGAAEADPEICKKILKCTGSGKPYKIIPQEFAFYKKMLLPLPDLCPDERHRRRMTLRNPIRLWERTCAKCAAPTQASYAPERPEIVYCEQCYLSVVY